MDLLLTADLGNSRLKLALWPLRADGGGPAVPAAFEAASGSAAELAALALRWVADRRASGQRVVAGALSSVARPDSTRQLAAALEATLGGERSAEGAAAGCMGLVVAPDAGLELAVAAPAEVGLDRRYAARAAFDLAGGPALVVDVGTCMTVSAVDRGALGGARFRGGAIAPGPRMLAHSLHQGTARLPLVEAAPLASALGGTTREAIAAGVSRGLLGAARELLESVAEAAALGPAPVLLTGGAREFLGVPGRSSAALTRRPLRVEEHLVALGLLAALRDALGQRARN